MAQMESTLNPYINFTGQTREALSFYHAIFGGEVTMSTFGESNVPDMPAEQIMHGQIIVDGKVLLMCSDAPMGGEEHKGFAISLSGNNGQELRTYWDKLSDGAEIVTTLDQKPWGDEFGQLVDKFGIMWMVDIIPKNETI